MIWYDRSGGKVQIPHTGEKEHKKKERTKFQKSNKKIQKVMKISNTIFSENSHNTTVVADQLAS